MSEAATRRGQASAFDPRVVLGLLLFGALAFLAMLYFIGSGQTGGDDNNGAAHAASKGLTGYAALASLLETRGHDVTISRNPAKMDDEALLILTPPHFAEADEIAGAIRNRRWDGPTLVILPKWNTMRIPQSLVSDAGEGWVVLLDASEPEWAQELAEDKPAIATSTPGAPRMDIGVERAKTGWSGLGLSGTLPDSTAVSRITDGNIAPLVRGEAGAILAGFVDDGGWYPALEEIAGMPVSPEDGERSWWAVTIVAEPDLMNNYGMADRDRAELAVELVEAAMEGEDLPIVFDVTMNGLGRTKNLLTLAFTPPFLAATLCLVLAALIAGWRAFMRFGPTIAEGRQISFGKERLVRNSAGLIVRTGRLHLLAGPYADMMRLRFARLLGVRAGEGDEAISAALARRLPDEPSPSQLLASLEAARSQSDIMRAADALQTLERKLKQ